MAKVKINGSEFDTGSARTILDVTRANHIPVPTFCYNPELSIAANCRMCLVEVKGAPKLLPACQTDIRDGMEISTESSKVKAWQQQNLEFILLHHPVDCPICDQAGECDLQEHYQRYDRKPTRLWSFRDKHHKHKRVVLGPHIVYDSERCILCTQCIRFCAEVWGEHLLDSHWRGNHRHIIVAEGTSLDFPYSLMTAEVCPVGALTSRDFRFKKRVWMLESSEGICPGCATGCAVHVDHADGVVYRLRPRRDDGVNRAWLCDDGVLSGWLHNDGRVEGAFVGRGSDRKQVPMGAAVGRAAEILLGAEGGIAAVLSAEHTTEDNVALATFARSVLGVRELFLASRPEGQADRLLRSSDKNPNSRGALGAAGGSARSVSELSGGSGVKVVLALGPIGPAELAGASAVVISSRRGDLEAAAEVVLPSPSFAQASGSYVNSRGMRRSFASAMKPGVHDAPLPPSVATVLDMLSAAMGNAYRTADLEKQVASIAAAAAQQTAPSDGGKGKEG